MRLEVKIFFYSLFARENNEKLPDADGTGGSGELGAGAKRVSREISRFTDLVVHSCQTNRTTTAVQVKR